MGFLSNLLTRFTGVFSNKKEVISEKSTCPTDCGCEEPKLDNCVEKSPELICDIPSSALQVVEVEKSSTQEVPDTEQPKVEDAVERLVEVSVKDIKERVAKKTTSKEKNVTKKSENKKGKKDSSKKGGK